MKVIKALYTEAFSKQAGKGNPAGIIFDADNLTTIEMQTIAKLIGFNETCFILKSSVADLRLRYFTPNHEMNLCGHGTVASICELMSQSIGSSKHLTIETLAGIINVSYDSNLHEVTMTQAPAEFKIFNGNIDELAASIGLHINDIDNNYPITYGSTGTWTLLVPIKHIASFKRMKPDNQKFSQILSEIPTSSIHPFSLETIDSNNDMHGRHFSASHSGTIEDPVTGTASGVMGAYYINYIKDINYAELKIEQGQEMGRDGYVKVYASKINKTIEVRISGTSVSIKEIILNF